MRIILFPDKIYPVVRRMMQDYDKLHCAERSVL